MKVYSLRFVECAFPGFRGVLVTDAYPMGVVLAENEDRAREEFSKRVGWPVPRHELEVTHGCSPVPTPHCRTFRLLNA